MSVQCPSCLEWAPSRLVEKTPTGWECAYCRDEPGCPTDVAGVLKQHLDWYEDRWAPRNEDEERDLIRRTRVALHKAGVSV